MKICPIRNERCLESACQWWGEWVHSQDVVQGCAMQCLAMTAHEHVRRTRLWGGRYGSWLMGEFRHIERDRDGGPVGIPRHPVIWCVQDGGMEGHDEG
jgi:hypothetical protein